MVILESEIKQLKRNFKYEKNLQSGQIKFCFSFSQSIYKVFFNHRHRQGSSAGADAGADKKKVPIIAGADAGAD